MMLAEAGASVDAATLNEIEAECKGDPDCIDEKVDNLTRIKMMDNRNNVVTISMPSAEKKKITFHSPRLTVEDAGFRASGSDSDLSDCEEEKAPAAQPAKP